MRCAGRSSCRNRLLRAAHCRRKGTQREGETMKTAQVLVEMLKDYGVEHIFGVPGDTTMVLYDALYHARSDITHIMTRDERSASFMADAYARLTGRPGITEAPSGGGA